MRLTKRVVDGASYPASNSSKRAFVLWDRDVKGFGVRVYPSGRKTFVFKYTLAGRGRWLTLGDYGPLTVSQARKRAMRARVQVSDGEDPREASQRRNARHVTIADLAIEYMAEVSAKRKPSTARAYRQLLTTHLVPAFGRLRPEALETADVRRFHRGLQATPYAANRALFLLSNLLTTAEHRGLRAPGSNPCNGVRRYPEQPRTRYLSRAEIQRLGDAIEELESDGRVSVHAAAALRLLLFTGCRVSEILTLRWEHLDFELNLGRLPDTKTGEKFFPLTSPVLELLDTIPRSPGNPWVIQGQRSGQHLTDLARPWRRVKKLAGLSGVRIHDLRHTVGAWGASSGLSLLLVGKVLGHRRAASTERYAHVGIDPVREAAEQISGEIRTAMNSTQNLGTLIEIAGRE